MTLLADVVATARVVTATSKRTQKRDVLAELLARLHPDEIVPVVGVLLGEPRQGRIGVGWAAIRDLDCPPADEPSLTVGQVDAALDVLATTTGTGSQGERRRQLVELFGRATAEEADLLGRLFVGDMRTGALAGVLTDAVAAAAGIPAPTVRRAAMLAGDLGAVARTALVDGAAAVEAVGLEPLRAVQPMLASTSGSVADAIAEVGEASVEWKLDGARIQVHRRGDEVRIYTRNLNDVTARLPEVAAVARGFDADALVLDGEVLGFLGPEDAPPAFQDTMSRFGRSASDHATVLVPHFFDVLHLDGADLIDEPLRARRRHLEALVGPHVVRGVVTDDAAEGQAVLDDALAHGHEGVMVKAADSPYEAGRRPGIPAGWRCGSPASFATATTSRPPRPTRSTPCAPCSPAPDPDVPQVPRRPAGNDGLMAVIPPQDLMFLLMEAREKPAHVGSLALFEPPPDADEHYLYDLYRSCIDSDAPVRSLFSKRVNRPGLTASSWVRDDQFDIEYHVRHSALPEPGRVRELLTVVSRLHGSLLDRNRPLWEAHLIEGLRDGRFAMYTKIHHALCDGVTAMRLLEASMSTDPAERDMPQPWARRPRGGVFDEPDPDEADAPPHQRHERVVPDDDTWAAVLADGLRKLRGGAGTTLAGAADATTRLLASFRDQLASQPLQAPHTILNVPITGARRFAADSWPTHRLRVAGAPSGATVNDVVLAMSAGALRTYLLERDALPDDPLVAMVPVSLKARGADDRTGNAVGAVLCSLGTHLDDPKARLEHIQASMDQSKSRLEGLTPGQILALSALNVAPAALHMSPLGRIRTTQELLRPPFNVVISNVSGPKRPLYWNGARLSGNYPLSVLVDGQALNITTAGYAGSIDFGILGCRRNVPSLQRLLVHLEDELTALEAD